MLGSGTWNLEVDFGVVEDAVDLVIVGLVLAVCSESVVGWFCDAS